MDALAKAIALILERGITLPYTAKSPPFGFLPAPSECELTDIEVETCAFSISFNNILFRPFPFSRNQFHSSLSCLSTPAT